MEDKLALLVPRIIFSLFALLSLLGALKPEMWINITIKWFKLSLKLYGFEGEIRPTPKAKTICRAWAFLMFVTCIVIALI